MPKYRFDDIAINSTEKKKPVEEDKYTYLGLEHLDSGSLKVTRFGSEVAPIGEKLVMRKGDVLFGKRRAYQKKVAIAPFDGIFSAHGMVLRPKEDVVDKDFFPLFISSDYFLDAAIKISVGSLSPTINWKDLKTLEFELPSLEEQRKLAEVLWSINDTLDAYKKLLEMTDQLVKSQFIEMSHEWSLACKYEPLSEYMMSITYGFTNPMPDTDEGPWKVTAKDIVDGKIDYSTARKTSLEEYEKLTAKSKPDVGDVLLTKDGTLGRVAIVDQEGICINQSVATIKCNERIIPKFLYSILQMPEYQEKMLADAGGVTVRHLYITRVDKMPVCIPSFSEQHKWLHRAINQNLTVRWLQISIYRDVWK